MRGSTRAAADSAGELPSNPKLTRDLLSITNSRSPGQSVLKLE